MKDNFTDLNLKVVKAASIHTIGKKISELSNQIILLESGKIDLQTAGQLL